MVAAPDIGDDSARRIVVVGGGASGVLVAIALVRSCRNPTEVVLVERAARLGEGVAYSTRDDLHRLNVPAAKMSACSAEADHFRTWAAERYPGTEPASFLPRSAYGSYLRDTLERSAHIAAARGVTLRSVTGSVVSLEPGPEHGEQIVQLADGSTIACGGVVVAVGILPAPELPVLRGVDGSFASPWQEGALEPLPEGGVAMLVGTGLTAVDAALSLLDGRPDVRVVAVSRTGLVPRAHLREPLRPSVAPPEWPEGTLGLDDVVDGFEAFARRVEAADGDWRDAFDAVRHQVPELWRQLTVADRRRFIREYVRHWDVRRHRMAPEVAERIDTVRAAGRLEVVVGAVASVHVRSGRCDVAIHPTGETAEATPIEMSVDRIVACTGLGIDIGSTADPLLRNLLDSGRAVPDELGIGLRTGDDGALIDANGAASDTIHVLGALRRGELWESTAVPELRAQAECIAEVWRDRG